jgi:hypothetical protein
MACSEATQNALLARGIIAPTVHGDQGFMMPYDVRFVPKADIEKKQKKNCPLRRPTGAYITTPLAIRAPPPPSGAGWSE